MLKLALVIAIPKIEALETCRCFVGYHPKGTVFRTIKQCRKGTVSVYLPIFLSVWASGRFKRDVAHEVRDVRNVPNSS